MNVEVALERLVRSESTSLRRWDAVLGRQVRDMWTEAQAVSEIDEVTPLCIETGALVQWAVGVYASKDAAGVSISPSEHLNVEGARLARYLVGMGWSGPAYVLNASSTVHERVCSALAYSCGRPVVGVRVWNAAGEKDAPTWDVRLAVHRLVDA